MPFNCHPQKFAKSLELPFNIHIINFCLLICYLLFIHVYRFIFLLDCLLCRYRHQGCTVNPFLFKALWTMIVVLFLQRIQTRPTKKRGRRAYPRIISRRNRSLPSVSRNYLWYRHQTSIGFGFWLSLRVVILFRNSIWRPQVFLGHTWRIIINTWLGLEVGPKFAIACS